MDKLVNDFVVKRPIEQTWAVLTDVERIAPCLPGAQLEEVEGDTYRGVVKVKLGAIATAFRGPGQLRRTRRREPPRGAARRGS